jgi:hypothetical protein
MMKLFQRLLLAGSLSLMTTPALAATITFDGTTSSSTWFNTPYSEAGYTLTPISANVMFFIDAAAQTASFPGLASFSGDVLEFNHASSSTAFALTQIGGGTFDLLSVVTGSLGRGSSDDGNFVFTGHLSGGGTVTSTVTGVATPQTHSFVGFTSLTSLTVGTTDGQFPVMDNLRLSDAAAQPVPEPTTVALLGIGLAGAAVGRFKRRRG